MLFGLQHIWVQHIRTLNLCMCRLIMFTLLCSSSTGDELYSRLFSWTCTQLFHVLCHKDPGPIQHWFFIYISFPFTVYVVVESFLESLHISSQIQSQVNLWFPNTSLHRLQLYTPSGSPATACTSCTFSFNIQVQLELLVHAGPLLPLLYFQLVGMDYSEFSGGDPWISTSSLELLQVYLWRVWNLLF